MRYWQDAGALQAAVVLLGALVLIFLLLWWRQRSARLRLDALLQQAGLDAGRQDERLDFQAARLVALAEERDDFKDALHQARRDLAGLERDLAGAQARLQTAQQMREEISGQFRLLADETLRQKGADLEKTHSDRLSALLTPFREQVDGFQRELRDRGRAVDQERARLREQIEGLHRRSEDLGREALALTRALKGDRQRQGAWGEMVLERLLEESGLLRGTHYQVQASTTDEQGRRWRPDVIVHMPQERALVIDAKVSLSAYERAVNADDAEARGQALRDLVAAVRAHVTGLSARGYQALDHGSVDYVLMFVPIEGALALAMQADPDLARFAVDRKVGLVTPLTLMLALRTVDHIWTVERRESNAMEIANRAGALYDKLHGFVSSVEDVGKALDQAQRAHHTALDRLARGPGNVIRQAEMLRELGARAQKKLALDHDQTDLLPGEVAE
ncbi:MAG: DNA recombination protein RmuC [Paracoccus sp. (in: a-proteobacteria)]|uniref:DNA recombination protein RmuC n=1 Tax=Paracoccus sp. TaxID=267 RepID=UPI0026DFF19C|nr:DNA recombination protein RmuC [Paracoccus sp. (in: a-proteobacteria)]MDO5622080.1 DNA recombination protein RmuC [Paracoccus sp. (in: a-proteobacteria)]